MSTTEAELLENEFDDEEYEYEDDEEKPLPQGLVAGLVLVLLILVSLFVTSQTEAIKNVVITKQSNAILLINGNPLTLEDYDLEAGMIMTLMVLNNNLGAELDPVQVLQQVVNKKIILLEAQKLNISATDTEVQLAVSEALGGLGLSQIEFESLLASQNVSWDGFNEYMKQLLVMDNLALYLLEDVPVAEQGGYLDTWFTEKRAAAVIIDVSADLTRE